MNELKIFYLKLRVEYKKKTLLGKIKDHNVISDFELVCAAKSEEEAVQKFRKHWKVDEVKKSLIEMYGGFDHQFWLNNYQTGWITPLELQKWLPLDTYFAYMRQELNKPAPVTRRRR
jgi:hypothetical protein